MLTEFVVLLVKLQLHNKGHTDELCFPWQDLLFRVSMVTIRLSLWPVAGGVC